MSEEVEKDYEDIKEQNYIQKTKPKSNKSVLVGLSNNISELTDRIEENKLFNSMEKQKKKLVEALLELKNLLDQKETKR